MRIKYWQTHLLLGCVLFSLMAACDPTMPSAPAEEETLDGPLEGLAPAELRQFLAGDVEFNDKIFTAATGLGPVFVAASCGGCHPVDGKGHPFTVLTRMGQRDTSGNMYLEYGGPQLQHRALPGYHPETIPLGATTTRLVAPANTGLGFIEAVADATIMEYADPDDADGNGISGRPNWIAIPHYARVATQHIQNTAGRHIGRFGKKAAVFDLLQQTAGAYNQDIGVVSTFEPVDPYSRLTSDPEITDQAIRNVVFYLRTLKAPIRRNADAPQVVRGAQVFAAIGCADCHRPSLTTGASDVQALANRTFHPYTDLLLHDMGAELDDGYTEGTAATSEWRTPPLWGLGLSKKSQGGQVFLLHDGRATSYRDAIQLHGGEGSGSRERFRQLPSTDIDALFLFLDSL